MGLVRVDSREDPYADDFLVRNAALRYAFKYRLGPRLPPPTGEVLHIWGI